MGVVKLVMTEFRMKKNILNDLITYNYNLLQRLKQFEESEYL